MQISAVLTFLAVTVASVHANEVTDDWGSWTISNAKRFRGPASPQSSYTFTVQYEGSANGTNCKNQYTNPGVNLDEACVCEDSAVTCAFSNNRANITLEQKLYQTKSIVLLKGSGSLPTLTCTMTSASGSSQCTGPTGYINVTSVSYQ